MLFKRQDRLFIDPGVDFKSIVGKALPAGYPAVRPRRRGIEAVLTDVIRSWAVQPRLPQVSVPHGRSKLSLRKEVIQPQVPLRLPCYDLVPVTEPGVGITVV